jgi:hypothetical protein
MTVQLLVIGLLILSISLSRTVGCCRAGLLLICLPITQQLVVMATDIKFMRVLMYKSQPVMRLELKERYCLDMVYRYAIPTNNDICRHR